MRLRRLDLARYGKFTDTTIDFGEPVGGQPDLHIVYGPNEAGKSTALAAFLDLLFGIEAQSRYGFLHPYATMRIGACLELSVGARELVRIKRPQPTLRDPGNQPIPEGLILGDLGGLDRNAYRTMFSLDDDTLEAGGKSILASNGELGQLLFSASAGLADLSKTLVDLKSETDGFYKLNSRSGELSQLKAALAGLKAERDDIDTLASEYNRLAAARDGAASQYNAALAEHSHAQARLAKIQRLLRGLPRLASMRQLRARLKPFDDIPDAPPGWQVELPGLQQAENGHRTKTELAEAEMKRLSDELEAIVVDERALRLAGSLDQLTKLRARYVTAELDLPSRRRELDRAALELSDILKRLGCEGEPEPSRLLLNAAQTAALRTLIETRSGIDASVATAHEEISEARYQLTEAKRALQETADTPDAMSAAHNRLAPVTAALVALRESDHAVRLRSATRARAQHSERLAELLAALVPWSGTVEELAKLRVPDAATVKAWETAAERDEASVDGRKAELERLEGELIQRQAELNAIGKIAGLVSDQEAAAIRSEREAAWAEHRRVLDLASADAFEAALRRDDVVGNARLGHERDLAKRHETAQAVAVKQAEVERARSTLKSAVTERQRRQDSMAASVAAIGPGLPADMSSTQLLSWMVRRDRALEESVLLRQCERDMREAEADAVAARNRFTNALTLAAVRFDADTGLDALAAVAQRAVDGEARLQTLRTDVTERERELKKRELAQQKAALADKGWHAAWLEACSGCWLAEQGSSLPFEAVREILEAITELGPALKVQASLADRIRSMEEDQMLLEHELDRVTGELGIDTIHLSKLDLAQLVEDQIQEASRAREARTRTADNLAMAQEKHRLVAAEASMHASRASEMTGFYQVGSLMEVAGRLRDAEQKSDLIRQIAEAERDIPNTLHVETLADAEAMLESTAEHELEIEQAELTDRLGDLDKRTRELFAASKLAIDRIEAVGGDDAAARIEERRRTKLLEIEDKALRYLRLRVGLAAADRGLRIYRDQHRSSMMTQASDAFKLISRGAYRGLSTQPDKEVDVLIAVGEDGGSKVAAELSKGTRFQLYLALRAAGYQEFAKLRRPVPFIADDIMETFDDFRAEEALRLFAEMAKVGQVIYLTHHDHLCAIAQRTIPNVQIHRLPTPI